MGRLLSRDWLAGLLFAAIGMGALALGASLPMGTPDAMEAGDYPRLVAGLIIALGAVQAAFGLWRGGERVTGWQWWPLLLVTAAPLAFAALLEPLGFVLAILAVVLLGCAAGRMIGVLRSLALAAVLVALNMALFLFALGLPLRPWPRL